MRVLVACECSQTVCKAFRKRGHEAYSCDIQMCYGEDPRPEWHILGDVRLVLEPDTQGATGFNCANGDVHMWYGTWDLIIAHPPCTYLSNAGACRLYPKKGQLNEERYKKGLKGKEFFMEFFYAPCKKICIENPIPSTVYNLPPYDQVIQPWQFGHPYSKKTCLWLKGLPPLMYTEIVAGTHISWVSGGSKDSHGNKRFNTGTKYRDSNTRSKTFQGIADAMAEQWG